MIGQFDSQEQINNYEVNVDGQGNNTLLPGDLIYKDVNGDGKIDGYDERPIGYSDNLPLINGGLSITANWKGFDLALDFSLASGYSFTAENELSRAFRANGGQHRGTPARRLAPGRSLRCQQRVDPRLLPAEPLRPGRTELRQQAVRLLADQRHRLPRPDLPARLQPALPPSPPGWACSARGFTSTASTSSRCTT